MHCGKRRLKPADAPQSRLELYRSGGPSRHRVDSIGRRSLHERGGRCEEGRRKASRSSRGELRFTWSTARLGKGRGVILGGHCSPYHSEGVARVIDVSARFRTRWFVNRGTPQSHLTTPQCVSSTERFSSVGIESCAITTGGALFCCGATRHRNTNDLVADDVRPRLVARNIRSVSRDRVTPVRSREQAMSFAGAT
jgi:hypothetical protein